MPEVHASGLLPPGANPFAVTARLASLPYDIVRLIVWNETLKQRDVAALRLTCRALSGIAATRLFYRISISKLIPDRDAFLTICRSPHLALHVHEVEWLEISWDVNLFEHVKAAFSTWPSRESHFLTLFPQLRAQAEAMFWLASVPARPTYYNGREVELDFDKLQVKLAHARDAAVAEFRDAFEAAIEMLPNLRTFISRPMTSSRIINPGSGYAMDAGLFQRFQDTEVPSTPQTNDGLFFFLIPAMDHPTSTVTRLRWADEFPGFSYTRALPASAFERLESMELCLTPSLDISAPSVAKLEAACVRAAPCIRHFKLCAEHGVPHSVISDTERMLLGPAFAAAPQCALRSLSLVAVQLEMEHLIRVIRANAESLRHLSLESVPVKSELIENLAKLKSLNLDSMQVVEEAGSTVCEHALVRYINKEKTAGHCRKLCNHSGGPDESANCDEAVRGLALGETSVFFLTSNKFQDVDSDSEGSGIDAASEASVDSLDNVDDRLHNVQDVDSDSDDSDLDVASEALADGLDNLDNRLHNGPKWAWAFFPHKDDPESSVYYYQVPDSHPWGRPTRCWKFTSRSGRVAYGFDPLDWFEEWDQAKGDVEEPTPFGKDLRRFAEGNYSDDGKEEGLGGHSENAWHACYVRNPVPPEGAIEYNLYNDSAASGWWQWVWEHPDDYSDNCDEEGWLSA